MSIKSAGARASSTDQQPMSDQHPNEKTRMGAGLRELVDKYDGFILDQFGVLHGALHQRI